MNRSSFLMLIAGVGFSILPVVADPFGTTVEKVPDISSKTVIPANKEQGLSKQVPIGDFDKAKATNIEPSKQLQKVRGKLIEKPESKQAELGMKAVKTGGKIISIPNLRQNKNKRVVTPVGDFGGLARKYPKNMQGIMEKAPAK